MNLIVCVDDHYGMSFNGRRVSRDRTVTERILQLCNKEQLYVSSYSASLFGNAENVVADDDFLRNCGDGDWCFVENRDVSECLPWVNKLVVFQWNRRYPSDLKFPADTDTQGWVLVCREEFPGSSHKLVTMEVYER